MKYYIADAVTLGTQLNNIFQVKSNSKMETYKERARRIFESHDRRLRQQLAEHERTMEQMRKEAEAIAARQEQELRNILGDMADEVLAGFRK